MHEERALSVYPDCMKGHLGSVEPRNPLHMTQQNILELAKQGNAQAIATLMNRSLTPKGITAKVTRQESTLQVALEAKQAPPQSEMVEFIRGGLRKLGIESIQSVKIQGWRIGGRSPVWSEDVELVENPFSAKAATPQKPKEDMQANSVAKGILTAVGIICALLFVGNAFSVMTEESDLSRQFREFNEQSQEGLRRIEEAEERAKQVQVTPSPAATPEPSGDDLAAQEMKRKSDAIEAKLQQDKRDAEAKYQQKMLCISEQEAADFSDTDDKVLSQECQELLGKG